MIPITKPFLPPIEEYENILEGIWDRNWLTNDGPLVRQLEQEICSYLGIKNTVFVSSGTMALQIALKVLGVSGEVVTTPFSYVATTSSIIWEGAKPVFVDVDRDTLNVDPSKIEEVVTPATSAFLFTHVYGIPCKIDEIQIIADKLGIPVIYDAAHAFGTKYKGKSIFNYGDISITSFHSTKVFHTIEGGALFTNDRGLIDRIKLMRNFGHNGPYKFNGIGINGKNSEFHAAMGIVNLKYIDDILQRRKMQYLQYKEAVDENKLKMIPVEDYKMFEWNFAYTPMLLPVKCDASNVERKLRDVGIFTRRYFYPLLSSLDYVHSQNFNPVAEKLSNRVLCVPMFHELTNSKIRYVVDAINKII